MKSLAHWSFGTLKTNVRGAFLAVFHSSREVSSDSALVTGGRVKEELGPSELETLVLSLETMTRLLVLYRLFYTVTCCIKFHMRRNVPARKVKDKPRCEL